MRAQNLANHGPSKADMIKKGNRREGERERERFIVEKLEVIM